MSTKVKASSRRASSRQAILALENGVVFEGFSFGAKTERAGELVFNTSMTGYQEILTDPSYKNQMVVMTYPEIGNYGINPDDNESDKVHVEGFIVKEYCPTPSNWRSQKSLCQFLKDFDVPGIWGIDTRYLTRILRTEGCLRAVLSTPQTKEDFNHTQLIEKAKTLPKMEGQNLADLVSTKKQYEFYDVSPPLKTIRSVTLGSVTLESATPQFRVIAFDLGIKRSILKRLSNIGIKVVVVPSSYSTKDILDLNPDGILLSNGPGDPAAVTSVIRTVKELIGRKPIFGICLGHQILGLALGGTTSKLKFGHHGANHPVMNLKTKAIEITSQNHNFVLDLASLKGKIEVTHMNLNDNTVEGLEDLERKVFSVQYHPEASPGPHDSYYLFNQFKNLMEIQGHVPK